MEFHVLSLFPEVIEGALAGGLVGQAQKKDLIKVHLINPRSFAKDRHQSADDRPYGGGDGMVLLPELFSKALEEVPKERRGRVIYLSPQGKKLDHDKACELAKEENLTLLCGRYSGIDQRLIHAEVDEEISIGDYVLTGGELPASVLIDAVARQIPGVLGHAESAVKDSFAGPAGHLEAPVFTRPAQSESLGAVPEILMGGNHAEQESWREDLSVLVTWAKRPDLARRRPLPMERWKKALKRWESLSESEKSLYGLSHLPRPLFPELAIALVHYPIVDGKGRIVATNITNFDIHDIARAAQVYGVDRYYIIHPMQEQLMFVERVLDHWRAGEGARLNPMRRTALGPVRTAESLEKALADWGKPEARVVATHAKSVHGLEVLPFEGLKSRLFEEPHLLVFGTGYGLTDEFMKSCRYLLEPIRGMPPRDYRHLSVRSAVSICLDRLCGPW